MAVMELDRYHTSPVRRSRYRIPTEVSRVTLPDLLDFVGRPALDPKQLDLLHSTKRDGVASIYYAGDLDTLKPPSVSIVGTRNVSEDGRRRARKLARELVDAGVTVVSGLAKGVDTEALTAALEAGGRTAAVIGTPLDKAYPAENSALQEQIYAGHLLLTPFAIGEPTFRGNFPKRNRVMAAVSDASVIVEASDTSGTLHQAAECGRLGRWLFIMRSVAENPSLSWPSKFIDKPRVAVISSTRDVLDAIKR